MEPYLKKIEIRWSDVDANRHVANTAYQDFLVQTRMSFLEEQGFGQQSFEEYNIGPVIFSEEFHYLQELPPHGFVYADIELSGRSENGVLTQFSHCIYNASGEIALFSKVTFGWLDLKRRKLIPPPKTLESIIDNLPRSENFRTLQRQDTRRPEEIPYGKKVDLEKLLP